MWRSRRLRRLVLGTSPAEFAYILPDPLTHAIPALAAFLDSHAPLHATSTVSHHYRAPFR